MCPFSRLEAYIQAMARNCLNPDMGKLLNEFNAFADEEIIVGIEMQNFYDIIEHLIKCRPCRQNLSFWAKHLFSSELFMRGHFLSGQAKIRRLQYRMKWRAAKGKAQIKLIDDYLKKSLQEPWKSEHKKIKQFIEN